MSRRQTEGSETWRRLREWDREQAPSERLAAHILRFEKYEAVDPSHPLGGQDGLKDLICVKEKAKFIAASYFPRGQQSLGTTIKKFAEDLAGVTKNSAEGIAFITNQELTLSEREELIGKAGSAKVDLFHLERIASILDSPQCYGIRLEFLDIEMTKEEQVAFMATVSQWSNRLEDVLAYISGSDVIRGELEKLAAAQEQSKAPQYVTPLPIISPQWSSWFGGGETLRKCSHCGYGYLIERKYTFTAAIFNEQSVVTCPRCGNAELA